MTAANKDSELAAKCIYYPHAGSGSVISKTGQQWAARQLRKRLESGEAMVVDSKLVNDLAEKAREHREAEHEASVLFNMTDAERDLYTARTARELDEALAAWDASQAKGAA